MQLGGPLIMIWIFCAIWGVLSLIDRHYVTGVLCLAVFLTPIAAFASLYFTPRTRRKESK